MDRLEQIGENLKYAYSMSKFGTLENMRIQMLNDIRYLYSELTERKELDKMSESFRRKLEMIKESMGQCSHLRTSGDGLREQQCLDCGELL